MAGTAEKSSSKKMYTHLVIPVALIGIITLLIFPLPTWLLDICIALNITISMVVMFTSLYIEKTADVLLVSCGLARYNTF